MKYDRRYYQIIVNSRLDPSWSEWFDGMNITWCDGAGDVAGQHTILSGYVLDQAALYGLLNKLGDLKLELVAVKRSVGAGRAGGVIGG